jgi:alkylation response protein AidB-like acyl-CoA dehydrogenase
MEGLAGPLSCLNEARYGIVFGAMGAARHCIETATAYAGTRSIFTKPLAAFQITQAKLADMTLELGKGVLLALHLGGLKAGAASGAGQPREAQQRPRGDCDRARVPHDSGSSRNHH